MLQLSELFSKAKFKESKTVLHSLYFKQVNYGFLSDVMQWLQ